MLVFTRKRGESFVIDGGITVTIVDIRGDKVRIGIEAPEDTKVMRSELLLKSANQEGEANGM